MVRREALGPRYNRLKLTLHQLDYSGSQISLYIQLQTVFRNYCGSGSSVVVDALCYKPEGYGFEPDEVNECQKQKKMFLGVECGRCVGLTTLSLSKKEN
jgi:hypothetical protein